MSKTMQKKTVFILGAGSSIGHSKGEFPDIRHVFLKGKLLGFDKFDSFLRITNYVNRVMGQDIRNEPVDVEAVFTNLEIDISSQYSVNLLGLKNDFIFLIQNILSKLEDQCVSDNGEYVSLRKILEENKYFSTISFNWDLLLDNMVGRTTLFSQSIRYRLEQYKKFLLLFSGKENLHWEQNEPYTNYESYWLLKDVGLYLKLHGSLDWYYCTNTDCTLHGRIFPVEEPLNDQFCFFCHEKMNLLLIPPILNKDIRSLPGIRRTWNVAKQELKIADELVIWGYSLPPTDFHSHWLLRQARTERLKKVITINPITECGERMFSLFRGLKVEYKNFISFNEYFEKKQI